MRGICCAVVLCSCGGDGGGESEKKQRCRKQQGLAMVQQTNKTPKQLKQNSAGVYGVFEGYHILRAGILGLKLSSLVSPGYHCFRAGFGVKVFDPC